MRVKTSLFIVLVAASLGVHAQTQKIVADKIVAQVGDKIILKSDIDNAIADIKRGDAKMEVTSCEMIESQMIQKALVLQAQKDSLPVSDDEIEAQLDNQVRGFIMRFGTKEALEEIAGKTVFQLKEDFRVVFRERNLADQMRRKILDNIKISPVETQTYYDKIPKDSLKFYETQLELSQIVIYPKANKDVDEYVTKQLYDIKRQIEAGGKSFEQMAKTYSDDPGSKDNGGQYTLNRGDKGMWDPTFMATAFRLREGQISSVIKSKFGFHIIQLVSRSGDDAVVRHILRIPPITDDEVKLGVAYLDSIRTKIKSGGMQFGEAVNKISEDEGSKFSGGAIMGQDGSTYLTYDQLDPAMVAAVKDLKAGDISTPQSFTDERGRKAVRILFLRDKTAPHRENMKDDYDRISNRALAEKKDAAMKKWFDEHISTYYVNVDPDYNKCSNLGEWLQAAEKSNNITTQK
ncbi:peptidylprolyl isomerase [Deminuibacter soli]|uniref:Peptidylprolyl isomerase n=1 Tax=Deminuibacter soli TaxID=2291815 RepID=A0A3E1NPY9_9BACT|nr:peptidylprolyl isomerase [Deminuibacter soli]RFM29996.1 peptidylprolyl isomerase [Deminuibacter soli]